MVPLPPLCGLDPIDGALPIVLVPLGPLPYPIDIVGVPAYLGIGGREGGPICYCLILFQLHLLSNIVNLLSDPSDGLDPGIALSLPRLSHNPICLIYLSYERFRLVPVVFPIHIVRPQPLPNIPLIPPNRELNLPSRSTTINSRSLRISLASLFTSNSA